MRAACAAVLYCKQQTAAAAPTWEQQDGRWCASLRTELSGRNERKAGAAAATKSSVWSGVCPQSQCALCGACSWKAADTCTQCHVAAAGQTSSNFQAFMVFGSHLASIKFSGFIWCCNAMLLACEALVDPTPAKPNGFAALLFQSKTSITLKFFEVICVQGQQ